MNKASALLTREHSSSKKKEADPIIKLSLIQTAARQVIFSNFRNVQRGYLTVVEGDAQYVFGAGKEEADLHVTVIIRDPRCYSHIASGGSISAAEAYMAGYWTCDDLTGLVRMLVRNQEVLEGLEQKLARITYPFHKAFQILHRNNKKGSRSNIASHYDLGNEFFSTFLDETMMYSCAFFEKPDATLYEASLAKMERVCQKLRLVPDDHLLEIGTGWGGLAIHAAQKYGCTVTTTTISEQQYEFARGRVEQEGVSDRVTVLRQDYRDLQGSFDKLVSIEMIEAVGHEYYEAFFRQCSHLMKPRSMMLLQAIVINDQRYEQAKRSVDFIQRFVFPGSCLPSITALCQAMSDASALRLFNLEDIGNHYPSTLRVWKERLLANRDHLSKLGYSDSFLRMWEYYFSYCEGGFLEGWISDVQMLFVKASGKVSSVTVQ